MRAFVLVHSPLVGPTTWRPVAQALRGRGATVIVPAPDNDARPYFTHHAQLVARAIAAASLDRAAVFVAHSGSGPSLPVIAQAAPVRAESYIFVDAPLPGLDHSSRLDRFTAEQANTFRRQAVDGVLPRWGEEWPDTAWQRLIPDGAMRERFRAELRPTPLALYEEPYLCYGIGLARAARTHVSPRCTRQRPIWRRRAGGSSAPWRACICTC
jgi:pimeloyl-ACP methyl ester carboxylesterase